MSLENNLTGVVNRRITGVEWICATPTDLGVVEITKDDQWNLDPTNLFFTKPLQSNTGGPVVTTEKQVRDSEIRSKEFARNLFNISQGGSYYLALAQGGILHFNPVLGNIIDFYLTSDTQFSNPIQYLEGRYVLIVRQDSSGMKNFTFNSSYTAINSIDVNPTGITVYEIIVTPSDALVIKK